MRTETIVSALIDASMDVIDHEFFLPQIKPRRDRQLSAFRDRILRMFAEKDAEIAKLDDRCFYLKRELEEQKRVWETR